MDGKFNLTEEILQKARKAENPNELIALAKENGMEITGEQAEKYYAMLHQTGELSDEELDNVSGGRCIKVEKETVYCPNCKKYYIMAGAGFFKIRYVCPSCEEIISY